MAARQLAVPAAPSPHSQPQRRSAWYTSIAMLVESYNVGFLTVQESFGVWRYGRRLWRVLRYWPLYHSRKLSSPPYCKLRSQLRESCAMRCTSIGDCTSSGTSALAGANSFFGSIWHYSRLRVACCGMFAFTQRFHRHFAVRRAQFRNEPGSNSFSSFR